MGHEPPTKQELTGTVALTHRLRERFSQLISDEVHRIDAYLAATGSGITRVSASRGASDWLKRPEIKARVAHLTSLKYALEVPKAAQSGATVAQGFDGPMPDLDTLPGRMGALKLVVSRGLSGSEKTSDSVTALKELIKISRDVEKIQDKSHAVDPAQIMVALSRIQGEGVSVAQIAEESGFSADELASRIALACGLDACTVRRGQSIGTHGSACAPAPIAAPIAEATASHSTAPQPAAAVHGDIQASTQGETEGAPPPPCANGGDTSGPKTSLPRNGICPTVESAEVPDSDWSDPAVAPVAQVKRARKPKPAEGSLAEFLKIK